MNFAYLDSRELLERNIEALEPIPCELDDKWKNFEQELYKYKTELATARRDLKVATSELEFKRSDITDMRSMIEGVTNQRLKDSLVEVVDKHESEEGVAALTEQCRELMGKIDEMKKVLRDTNAERYAAFTCFVCMDRLVNLFIDPCGHLICDYCASMTVNKHECPGCRGAVRDRKKIFTLS
jgi:hypothetical protein